MRASHLVITNRIYGPPARDQQWQVQVFKTDTEHLKDVVVTASSKAEAEGKARAQVPQGRKFYAERMGSGDAETKHDPSSGEFTGGGGGGGKRSKPTTGMSSEELHREVYSPGGTPERRAAARKEMEHRRAHGFGRGDAETNAGEALHLFKKLGEVSQRAEAAGTPGLKMARRASKCLPGYYTDKDKFVDEAKAIIDDWYSAGSQAAEDRRDFERSLPEEELKFLEKYKHVEAPKEPGKDARRRGKDK